MKRLSSSALFLALAALAPAALAAPAPATLPEGYTVETIDLPKGVPAAVTGVDTAADGGVWICTREGDVWNRKGEGKDAKWTLFAEGLHEPCGLILDRKDGKETGKVVVAQKSELTELSDADSDGAADVYRRICEIKVSGNYHEFHHGLAQDEAGNFYGALNLGAERGAVAPELTRVRGTCMMARPSDFRGTVYKITPEGKFSVVAWGVRSPCGVARMKDGTLLYTENQGDYMPSDFLAVVRQDEFYGHPTSLLSHPDWQGKDLNAVPVEKWAEMRVWPAVWLPYRELSSSTGQPVEDLTGGKFGPFVGQLFVGDQTHSNLFRCTLQQVKGQWQGCAIDFINHTRCGIVRGAFDAQGRLYLGETGRGWGSAGDLPFALERVVWDGKTVPFCIKDIKLEKDGFRVSFTKPVDPASVNAAKVAIRHWTYKFTPKYGCDGPQDVKQGAAAQVQVAADKLSVLVKADLFKHRIYDLKFPEVKSADGKALSVNHGYYTLNETVE